MAVCIILRQDVATKRMQPASGPKGEKTWSDRKKAEAEQSRMRFRDEGGWYCVYTDIFASWDQASQFCSHFNAGMSIDKAMRLVRGH